jgi:hypothetical protein
VSAVSASHHSPAAFRSLMRAVEHSRHHHPHPCHSPSDSLPIPPCDSVECRFLINDARGEIERLRRQLAGLESSLTLRTVTPTAAPTDSRACERPSLAVDLTTATAARRAYAVSPIGEVRLSTREATEVAPPQPLQLHTVVTNLGCLLDVLI